MRYQLLGNSGLRVSESALGTMTFGDEWGWGAAKDEDDRMIPPAAQHLMTKRAGATVVEVPGSHSVYISRPDEVARLIARAAEASKDAATTRPERARLHPATR
jgi:hypothetical protein